MAFWSFFQGKAVSEVITSVGKGAGNVLDRMGYTTKMSDSDKIEKQIELIKATSKLDELDTEDLKSARELAIHQLNTQPASWLVRNLNGALRPVAGWIALMAITDKWWGQVLAKLIDGFSWVPIEATPVEEFIIGGILAFYFGFRQRSKEKQVNMNA